MNQQNTKPSLAVALIVKNEAKHLAACLDSVKDWVDEIVILDSGSTDKTEAIARQYTDKFYVSDDWPGFGIQRQRAQQYIQSDYVLWLDADERVTPELKISIENVLQSPDHKTVYLINRLSSAFGQFIHHSGWSPDWLVRLYSTQFTQYNDALVHEKVIIPEYAQQQKLSGRLHHHTYDNLHHYIEKTTKYIKAWTDEREGRKKSSITTALLHAFASFLKMYVIRLGFLDGRRGFILAWLTMHSTFVKYTDLWLREQQDKTQ
ncbi:glycosyltransferase [Photobacterium angustum]|uniref:glycosyltransferase family 2 protein n=1 Tax=Photobacterium angustum TaxID=661 RepID=UPI0005E1883F|nr:glycosyltransferase family 2 protein [Photobacterium angustum]KJG05200.1 glycosyltransferase [Photobacterium angustum]PSV93015.1 glycosyltransferase family 2 protein [Photobacterium angustum]PSW79483.1 glycosyltransferase family 2 protein [Photobacterium angustum]